MAEDSSNRHPPARPYGCPTFPERSVESYQWVRRNAAETGSKTHETSEPTSKCSSGTSGPIARFASLERQTFIPQMYDSRRARPEDLSMHARWTTPDCSTLCGLRPILRSSPTVVRHFRNDRLNLINGLDGMRRRLARKHSRLLNRPRNVRAVLQGRSRDLRVSNGRHSFRRCTTPVGSSRRMTIRRALGHNENCWGLPLRARNY